MQNAVEYLKQCINPLELLQLYRVEFKQHGHIIRCACPIHKGHNKEAFVWNLEKNLWFCHTDSCGGGDIYDFVMKMEHISFIESVSKLAELFHIDITDMEVLPRIDKIYNDTKQWINTMRKLNTTTEIAEFDISTLGELYPLNSYRNFNKYILQAFEIKYCKNNERIVVPLYFNNILVGVTMRRTNNHPAKWLHLPSGIQTANYLYNYDNIVKNERIIIVEGVWDVINLCQYGISNVVATYGAHLTTSQEQLLLTSTYEIWLAYDPDKAGIEATNNIIDRLRHKMNIFIIPIPTGKDAGNLTKEEIDIALQNKLNIVEWRKLHAIKS